MNELTKHRQTALHLAAQQDLPTICSVLLENGVDFAAVDENGNNGNSQAFPVCGAKGLKHSLPSGVAGQHAPLGLFPVPEIGSYRGRAVTGNALSCIKQDEIMRSAATRMDLEIVILSAVIQTEQDKYRMI